MKAVTVLGLGHLLNGDSAVGPHVVRWLQAFYEFDPQVSLYDVGALNLDLLPRLSSADAIVVVTAVKTTALPARLPRPSAA